MNAHSGLFMPRPTRFPTLIWGFLLFTLTSAAAVELQDAETALFRLDPETHWTVFGRLEQGKRQVSQRSGTLTLDTRRITAGITARLLPGAYGWSEVGISQAEVRGRIGPTLEHMDEEGVTHQVSAWSEPDRKGDPNLAWGIGGGLLLLDAILKESPVLGPREWVQLELQASYRVARSDLPAADDDTLRWADSRITPMLIYIRDQRGDPTLASFSPTGYTLRAGISLYRSRADLGRTSFETENGVGFELGSDLRLRSGWICRLQASWLDSSNRETSLAILRRF
ncbi:MAG: hypothetical protein JJU05_12590 [Verrucomicrobia bacterium]|nr:hypothetical protein [Verrucomicrobiota bacterium]MCH8528391.1 hypothetical protein [Kiritimatiellia bacterium]